MRFEELSLEKYGVYDRRTLLLAGRPALVVVYGPNEAGKSTYLSAVSDFLFGIPQNSTYGQVFGYDQMRLGAILRLASGASMNLRRRKGRSGRTLTDEKNEAVEENLLAMHFGGTTRERFETLFGLNHTTLRLGGERLLEAGGDIGRLIVEAGGGLHSLLTAIADLTDAADGLFSTRRSAERAFYKALDAYESAETDAKAGLLTRERFEEARKQHEAAMSALGSLRQTKRTLDERASRAGRLVRVVPLIAERDRTAARLHEYVDLPMLRAEFPQAARGAISTKESATSVLLEAETKRAQLAEQVEGLIPSAALLEAEAEIRESAEKATHAAKARADRPNRETELAESEAKLSTLRQSVGLAEEVDLEPLLPSQSAILRAQELVAQGLDLHPKVEGLQLQIEEGEATLETLETRQASRREAREDTPFGIATTDFANLAPLARTLEAKRVQAHNVNEEIERRCGASGFESLEELRALACPDAATVQSQIERRTVLEAALRTHSDAIRGEKRNHENAATAIRRLSTGAEIPTEGAIATARQARENAWAPIRDVYLSDDPELALRLPTQRRRDTAELLEEKTAGADALADRRSVEAQRIAALHLAEKQRDESAVALETATAAKREADEAIEEARRVWAEAWPAITHRESDLTRLKALVDERRAILERAGGADALRFEIAELTAEFEPRLEALALAEQQLQISGEDPAEPIAARVQTVTRRITHHEANYSDYRQDASLIADLTAQLARRRAALELLQSTLTAWRGEWAIALRNLKLPGGISPERGNEVATQWAAARGVLDGIRITRMRLARMNEDEAELKALIANLGELEFPLPDDPIAAARMLDDKRAAAEKVATQRATLSQELKQQTRECETKRSAVESATATITALCIEANCTEHALSDLARRCDQHREWEEKLQQKDETILSAGDGHTLETIREQGGGRDLDAIRAELQQIQEETLQVERALEESVATAQDRKRERERVEAMEGISQAVARQEEAATEIHRVVERYVTLRLTTHLLTAAIDQIRGERRSPLVTRAGELFALSTRGAFVGVETDVDDNGDPVVVGKRANGDTERTTTMSEGTRDQLFLAFRLASVEHYCKSAEPMPFVADDVLVHFDDERSAATLDLLAQLAKTTQVMLFTHHRGVRDAALRLVERCDASILDMESA